MKKRFLGIMMTMLMVLAMIPAMAFAIDLGEDGSGGDGVAAPVITTDPSESDATNSSDQVNPSETPDPVNPSDQVYPSNPDEPYIPVGPTTSDDPADTTDGDDEATETEKDNQPVTGDEAGIAMAAALMIAAAGAGTLVYRRKNAVK